MSPNFSAAVKSEVARIKKENSLNDDSAFLLWCAEAILDLSEDDAHAAISIEGANDKGVDLFHVDDEDQRVIIGQGKYSSSLKVNIKESHVSSLLTCVDWLMSPEALRNDGKEDLADAAEAFVEAIGKGYAVEFLFLYTAPKSANIEKKIHAYNANPENAKANRAARHYHLDILKSLWEETQGLTKRIPAAPLSLVGKKILEHTGSFGDAAVVTLKAKELGALYEQHGDKLFDRNVRLYLGARRGSVNASIQTTLSQTKDRGHFWAYNNGITIICDKYEVSKSSDKIELENFSIINGCQTTVSIAQMEGLGDNVTVLARVIAAPPTIVDNVIKYNNSQNPMRLWDIASQDKTQRQLKSQFEKLKKPYFYLTRRGAKPPEGLKKFRDSGGKIRQIRIDTAGQYSAAWLGKPVLAYKNKGLIFSQHHDLVFPADLSAVELLFQNHCGEVCRDLVRQHIASDDAETVRILKKGGHLFVLATLAQVIALRNGVTYKSKISEENALSNNTRKAINSYAKYALSEYVDAVQICVAIEKAELSTLIRSPEFYEKVRERVKKKFNKDAMSKTWINEALPKLFQG